MTTTWMLNAWLGVEIRAGSKRGKSPDFATHEASFSCGPFDEDIVLAYRHTVPFRVFIASLMSWYLRVGATLTVNVRDSKCCSPFFLLALDFVK